MSPPSPARRSPTLILPLLLLSLALSSPPDARPAPASPGQSRHLRVVAAPYEPFAFDRDGVPSGLDLDLLNVVCRANRWTYELEWVPFGEVWERLRSGKADLAVGALYSTPERRAAFPTTRSYLQTGLGIISRPDRPVNGPGDLVGLRIGVKAKATGEAWARRRLQSGTRFTLVPFPSTEESFEALLRGEVDAVLNDHLNSEFLLASHYAGRLVVARRFGSPLLLTRDGLAFPLRPGLEPVRDTFDSTLRELERGGTLDRLRWQWLPPGGDPDWGRLLGWALGFLGLLALAGGIGLWQRRRNSQRRRLADSERHYRQLVEQAPLGILLVRGKEVAFASPKALEILHAPTGQGVIGLTVGDLVVAADRQRVTALRLAMEAGDRSTHSLDLTARRPDGSTFPGHVLVRRADLEGGAVTLVLLEDRSSLRQTEARLEDSEQARARFLKNLPGMAYHGRGDRDRTMLAVSEGALELTGYWPEELTTPPGPRYLQIIHPDDCGRVAQEAERALAAGSLLQLRYRIRTASGKVKWVFEQGWPVPGTGHPPSELEGFIIDETEGAKAREELAQREADYRRLFEDSSEGIYVSTVDGKPVLANPALLRMLGFESEEELSRRDIAKEGYVDPEDRARFAALMERDGRVSDFESRWYRKDRSVIWTIVNSRAILGPDGRVALYEGMVRDVTEERRAQAALVESEARYRELFESSYDAIFLADPETGRLLDGNRRAQELIGRSRDEIRAMCQMELHPEEERERYRKIFADHAHDRVGGLTPDLLVVHRDGRRIPVEIAGSTFEVAGRRVQIGIFRDVTQRRRTEADLLRYKFMLDHAADESYLVRPDGTLLYANEAAARSLGYTLDELLALGVTGIDPVIGPRFAEHFRELRTGEIPPFETAHIAKDGRRVPKEIRSTLIRFGGEEMIFGTGRDISARKAADQALRESEARLRAVLEFAPVATVIVGAGGAFEFINRKFTETFGYSREEVPDLDHWARRAYPDPAYREALLSLWERLVREATAQGHEIEGGEYQVTCRDGSVKTCFIFGAPVGDKYISMLLDVTERRAAEAALRDSEAELRAILEHSPISMAIVSLDGTVEFINRRVTETTGYRLEDIPTMERWWALAFPDPARREAAAAAWGDRFRRALGEGRAIEGHEYRITCKDGTERTALIFGVPVGGKIFVTSVDVTERLAAENALRKSEAQYRLTIDSMADAVHLVDRELRILLFNRTLQRWVDELCPADRIAGRTVFEVFPFLPEKVRAEYEEVFRTGVPLVSEDRVVTGLGTVYTETRKAPVQEDGRVARVLTVIRDVTERHRAETALRESEGRLRKILEQSPISMAIVGLDGTIEYINRKAVETFGFAHEEIPTMERWWAQAYPDPAYREEVIAGWTGRVEAALAGGHEIEGDEYRVTCKDGSERTVFIFGVPVAGKVFVMFQDVTERRRAEAEALEYESRLRAILAHAPLIFFALDAEGRFTFSDGFALGALGLSPGQVVGQSIAELPAASPATRENIRKVLQGEARTWTTRIADRVFEAWASPQFRPDGRVRGAIGLALDATERTRAEEALRESEERYRVVIEQTGHLIYDLEVSTGAIRWSGAIEAVTGWPADEFHCDLARWEESIHPEDRTQAMELLGEAMASLEGYRVEYRFRRSDGSYVWVDDHGVFLASPEGKAARMLGTMADITPRRAVLDALRRSEQDYRGLFERVHDAIILFEPEGEVILDANPSACALYGFDRADLLGRSLVDFSKDPARGKRYLRDILAQGTLQGFETVHFRKDGSEMLLEVNASIVEFGGRKAVLSLYRDVTERRRAEEEVRSSRERLQLILDRTPLACVVWDTQFRVTFWNPAAQRLFGYTAGEALGRHPYELIVPPEAREHVDDVWRRLLEGDETAHSENENHRADGSHLLCEWFNTPLKDSQGKVVGVLSMAQDITERRRAERQIVDRNRQLSALLASSQSMTGFLDLRESARSLCEAALEAFDLRMAWLGLVVPESTEVQVIASAGFDEGYTEQVRVRWDESPRGQGPTGRCIKTRRPVVGHPEEAGFAPWRQAADSRGYRSSCALPLVHEDSVRGALTLYSADPHAFGPETLEVLQIFARQATMLIVNAALYEEARRTVEALLAAPPPDHPAGT